MTLDTRSKTVVEVVEEISAELNPNQENTVVLNTHLEWDLGLGSIERHELLVRLERALGERLPSNGVFQAATVSDLLKLTPGAEVLQAEQSLSLAEGEIPPHPAHTTNLIEALLYQAEHQPTRQTLHFLEEGAPSCQWTYPDLLQACQKVAGGLNSLGIQPGERVGIMLPSGPDYLASFYGVLWIGAVPVPLYPPFRLDQLEDYVKRQAAILSLAGVRHLISFDRAKPVMPLLRLHTPKLEKILTVAELDAQAPPPRPHEHALIQFTSGSTGLPKGVVLSHQNLIHNIRGYGFAMNLGASDVTVSWLPLYHDMGLIGTMLGSVYHGQPLVLMGPQDFLARPSRWLWALHNYRGTVSPAPNFAYEICARKIPDEEIEGLDLSHWRIALNGAEAVRPETLDRFTERFAPYGFRPEAHFPAYGLAEASLAVTFPPPGRGPIYETFHRETFESEGVIAASAPHENSVTLVACGRPLPDMEVRIMGTQGQVLDEKRQGSVEFRGPSSLQCYFDNEEVTAATKDEFGWVKTGDLGFLSEGELYITGRSKDVIILGGRNVQPEDVEDVAAGIEGVRRGCVAAFGVTDETEGTERLVLVAETRSKDSQEKQNLLTEIEREVVKSLGVATPQVVLVPPHTIPKTPSGKIRRSETKSRWLEGDLRPSGGALSQAKKILQTGAKVYAKHAVELPRKWFRSSWCLSCLGGLLTVPQIISLASPALAKKSLGPLAKLYLKSVGIHLDVRGVADYSGPCVVVSNHCSTLDPLSLCALWSAPLTFLVAPWVSEHFALKHLISRLGHIPVHRGDPEAAQEQERVLLERLKQGESLAIFPEGGIEISPGLRPFALGAFQLAAQAGVPVIPVGFQGSRAAQPYPRVVPFPTPLLATIGPPMFAQANDWKSVVALSNEVRGWIAEHCGDPISHRRLRRHD